MLIFLICQNVLEWHILCGYGQQVRILSFNFSLFHSSMVLLIQVGKHHREAKRKSCDRYFCECLEFGDDIGTFTVQCYMQCLGVRAQTTLLKVRTWVISSHLDEGDLPSTKCDPHNNNEILKSSISGVIAHVLTLGDSRLSMVQK